MCGARIEERALNGFVVWNARDGIESTLQAGRERIFARYDDFKQDSVDGIERPYWKFLKTCYVGRLDAEARNVTTHGR